MYAYEMVKELKKKVGMTQMTFSKNNLFLHVCVPMHAPWHVWRSWLSPYTMWVPRITLKLQDAH